MIKDTKQKDIFLSFMDLNPYPRKMLFEDKNYINHIVFKDIKQPNRRLVEKKLVFGYKVIFIYQDRKKLLIYNK